MLKVLRIDTNASIWASEKSAGDCVSEGDGVSVGGISHSMGKSKGVVSEQNWEKVV